MFVINIYNESSVVTNDEVKIMIAGCELLLPILCEKWSILVPSIQFIEGNPLNSSNNSAFVMLDNSDQVGALAYHTEKNNVVDGYIFCKTILENGGVKFYKDNNTQTIASALFHELAETIIDPTCNIWWDDFKGTLYSAEICDPVQNGIVSVNVDNLQIGLSDFIYPSWKDTQSPSNSNIQFNYLNTLKSPFTLDNGGYCVIRNKYGKQSQITKYNTLPWILEYKKLYSRVSLRLKSFRSPKCIIL